MINSRYRLNILAQITYGEFETSLKLSLGKKAITLEKNQYVENFLKYIEENIFFNNDTLTDFSVDQHFLALLLKIGVVTKSDFNSGIEAICLDDIMLNPSKMLKHIDFKTIELLMLLPNKGRINEMSSDIKKVIELTTIELIVITKEPCSKAFFGHGRVSLNG